MSISKPLNPIVLIDDDDVAIESATRSLRKWGVDNPIFSAMDGMAGLALLRGQSPSGRLPGAPIVMLDLNMPNMNGFEFLDALRADQELRSTVVFILSTSNSDFDRSRAYQEHVAGFMVKSALGPQFSKLANFLKAYHDTVSYP